MGHHKRTPAICVVCGGHFMASLHDIARGWGKCCSRRCKGVLYSRTMATPAGTKKEKQRANGLVNMRQRSGKLVSPTACEDCGQVKKLDKHHEDYAKPGEVNWLCRSCHMKRHRAVGVPQ